LEDANPAEESQPTIRPVQIAFDDLLVVRQFGEPIFPALSQVDCVANGPADAPWHTLIEADNYHALQLLDYLYAGKVDCIYIDPPYNTGSRDWKYNNHYIDKNDAWRHSKWLAFMEKRLLLAKRLLKTDSSTLIITIDEHEIYHLGMLLESLFPDAVQQLVTIVTNQKGVEQGRFARVEEYACFCFFGKSTVPVGDDDLLSSGLEGASSRLAASSGPPRWERLQRGGNNANPVARYGLFYPVYVDPTTKRITSVGRSLAKGARPTANELGNERIAWPIRRDGSYATWQVGPDTLERLINDGLVRLGGYDKKKKNVDHPLLRVESSRANT
jgi:adenine-specific DNA-methyltransferase